MKYQINQIITGVIILVLAMIIFSYLFNPLTKYQTKQFFSNIGVGVSNIFSKIPTPSKISCEQKASELVPKFILFSETNYWIDGEGMSFQKYSNDGEICLRKGTSEGENINYYYYKCNNWFQDYDNITYSKKIIDENGYVKGFQQFTLINLVFNKKDINFKWEEELDKKYKIEGMDIVEEKNIYRAFWSGFDNEVKEIFNIETIKINIYSNPSYMYGDMKKKIFCKEEITSEKGSFECEINPEYFNQYMKSGVIDGKLVGGMVAKMELGKELVVEVSSNIKNEVYELIDYKIKGCTWIEN